MMGGSIFLVTRREDAKNTDKERHARTQASKQASIPTPPTSEPPPAPNTSRRRLTVSVCFHVSIVRVRKKRRHLLLLLSTHRICYVSFSCPFVLFSSLFRYHPPWMSSLSHVCALVPFCFCFVNLDASVQRVSSRTRRTQRRHKPLNVRVLTL